MRDTIQKSLKPQAGSVSRGKPAPARDTALQRMVDASPRQLATQAQLSAKPVVDLAAPIQRAIKKPPPNSKYTYKTFPGAQLRQCGMLLPHEPFARTLYEDGIKRTLQATANLAKEQYKAANRGIRVYGKNAGTRLNTHVDVIDHFQSQGQDTTKLEDKFITSSHGSAFDALLTQVPLTDTDLLTSRCNASTASSIYADLTYFINREHVPVMIRTPSFLCETAEAMNDADSSTGSGYVSSTKGSILEAFTAYHFIPGSARVTVLKQGGMKRDRTSDGFAGNVLYDTKFYDSTMPKSTTDNQWYDYKEIVTRGYTGTNGEAINSICYIFPNILAAQQNTHLKDTDIAVAYLDKVTMGLKYV